MKTRIETLEQEVSLLSAAVAKLADRIKELAAKEEILSERVEALEQ